jgi:hypothetical protein
MQVQRDENWLAAYAIGLASAMRPQLDAVRELQLAAGARPELLDEARLQLRRRPIGDAALVSAATTLLVVAAGSVPALG